MQSGLPAAGEISPSAGNNLPRGSIATQFVINLSASTSPMGLTPPTLPELKRFKFFVSRRREDGRERFRLHMGYFSSQEEAEKLLELVREIYPAAWAGVAPGQRLHAPVADVAAPPAVAGPVAIPSIPTPLNQTAPAVPVTATVLPAPVTEAAERPITLSLVEEPPVARFAPRSEPEEPVKAPLAPTLLALPVLEPPQKPVPTQGSAAAQSLNSVRAAIASLDETPPRDPLAPAAAAAPVAASVRTGAAPPAAADPLSASQTLRVLEQGTSQSGIRAMPGTRAEPTLFAVQLLWSVQPIDQSKIPPLAIFSAYTLYGAEGNRDGRRWYGLRLGFFTDTVSAQQVAHYVRSEFKAVSIVPVSARERERASAAMPPKTAPPSRPAPAAAVAAPAPSGEFKLLDDRGPAAATPPAADSGPARVAAPATPLPLSGARRATKPAPGKRAKYRVGRAPKDTAPKGKLSLEETLEILGANSLQIDKGRGELLNDSGIHRVSKSGSKSPRGSSLLSLIDRLTERFGN